MPTENAKLDAAFMREAIRLSRRGFPAPNPHVGCVLVRDGAVIGRGFHHHAGAPHGEVAALIDAKWDAAGATAYVTLEPCNHTGRTGPCSHALQKAGIRRVVVACPDPNPRAAGGAEYLRAHGIPVEVGLLEDEARAANEQFFFALRHRRPLVVAKAAMSLDGRIALPSGESKWITSPAARRQAHRLRAELGAVLVGRRTVELDDPSLTARIPGVVNQPVRVVLDPERRLPCGTKVFDDAARTLHLGRVDGLEPGQVLERLYGEGITGVLIEGGAITLGHFVRAGLVDRLELFVAPKLLGDGPSWLSGLQLPALAEAPELEILRTRRCGPDLWLTARFADVGKNHQDS